VTKVGFSFKFLLCVLVFTVYWCCARLLLLCYVTFPEHKHLVMSDQKRLWKLPIFLQCNFLRTSTANFRNLKNAFFLEEKNVLKDVWNNGVEWDAKPRLDSRYLVISGFRASLLPRRPVSHLAVSACDTEREREREREICMQFRCCSCWIWSPYRTDWLNSGRTLYSTCQVSITIYI